MVISGTKVPSNCFSLEKKDSSFSEFTLFDPSTHKSAGPWQTVPPLVAPRPPPTTPPPSHHPTPPINGHISPFSVKVINKCMEHHLRLDHHMFPRRDDTTTTKVQQESGWKDKTKQLVQLGKSGWNKQIWEHRLLRNNTCQRDQCNVMQITMTGDGTNESENTGNLETQVREINAM